MRMRVKNELVSITSSRSEGLSDCGQALLPSEDRLATIRKAGELRCDVGPRFSCVVGDKLAAC